MGHIQCPLTIETRFQLPAAPFAQSNNTVPARGAHECNQDVCVAAVPADRSEIYVHPMDRSFHMHQLISQHKWVPRSTTARCFMLSACPGEGCTGISERSMPTEASGAELKSCLHRGIPTSILPSLSVSTTRYGT